MEMAKEFGMEEYEFAVHETKTSEVIQNVKLNRSEIGILYKNEFNSRFIEKILRENDLEFIPLFDCHIYVYLSKGNPLAQKEKIDFEELQRRILKEKRMALLEKLKASISSKLSEMLTLNSMRRHLQEKFEHIIEEYNAGKLTMEQMYVQLVALTNELTAEEKRHLD